MSVSSDHGRFGGLFDFSATRDTRSEFDRGFTDGQKEIPRSDSAHPSPYEVDILMVGKRDAQHFLRTMEVDLAREAEELALRKQQLRSSYRADVEDLNNKLSNKLDDLENESGETSVSMDELLRKRETATERVDEIFKELGRPLRTHFVFKVARIIPAYILILFLLAFADVTANQPVFIRFFTGAPVLAWMLAGGFGLLLVFLAHAGGMFLKRSRQEGRGRVWRDWLQLLAGVPAIVLISGILMYFVGALRQVILNEQMALDLIDNAAAQAPVAESTQIFPGLTQVDQVQDLASRLEALREVSFYPWELTSQAWALIGINFAVFLAGMLTAYIRYDSHPDYEHAEKEVERAQTAIEALRARHRMDRKSLLDESERERTNIRSRANRAQSEIEKRESKRFTLQRQRDARIREFETNIMQRIMRYQDGNIAGRRTDQPEYFGEPTVVWVRRSLNDVLNPPMSYENDAEEGTDEQSY